MKGYNNKYFLIFLVCVCLLPTVLILGGPDGFDGSSPGEPSSLDGSPDQSEDPSGGLPDSLQSVDSGPGLTPVGPDGLPVPTDGSGVVGLSDLSPTGVDTPGQPDVTLDPTGGSPDSTVAPGFSEGGDTTVVGPVDPVDGGGSTGGDDGSAPGGGLVGGAPDEVVPTGPEAYDPKQLAKDILSGTITQEEAVANLTEHLENPPTEEGMSDYQDAIRSLQDFIQKAQEAVSDYDSMGVRKSLQSKFQSRQDTLELLISDLFSKLIEAKDTFVEAAVEQLSGRADAITEKYASLPKGEDAHAAAKAEIEALVADYNTRMREVVVDVQAGERTMSRAEKEAASANFGRLEEGMNNFLDKPAIKDILAGEDILAVEDILAGEDATPEEVAAAKKAAEDAAQEAAIYDGISTAIERVAPPPPKSTIVDPLVPEHSDTAQTTFGDHATGLMEGAGQTVETVVTLGPDGQDGQIQEPEKKGWWRSKFDWAKEKFKALRDAHSKANEDKAAKKQKKAEKKAKQQKVKDAMADFVRRLSSVGERGSAADALGWTGRVLKCTIENSDETLYDFLGGQKMGWATRRAVKTFLGDKVLLVLSGGAHSSADMVEGFDTVGRLIDRHGESIARLIQADGRLSMLREAFRLKSEIASGSSSSELSTEVVAVSPSEAGVPSDMAEVVEAAAQDGAQEQGSLIDGAVRVSSDDVVARTVVDDKTTRGYSKLAESADGLVGVVDDVVSNSGSSDAQMQSAARRAARKIADIEAQVSALEGRVSDYTDQVSRVRAKIEEREQFVEQHSHVSLRQEELIGLIDAVVASRGDDGVALGKKLSPEDLAQKQAELKQAKKDLKKNNLAREKLLRMEDEKGLSAAELETLSTLSNTIKELTQKVKSLSSEVATQTKLEKRRAMVKGKASAIFEAGSELSAGYTAGHDRLQTTLSNALDLESTRSQSLEALRKSLDGLQKSYDRLGRMATSRGIVIAKPEDFAPIEGGD